MTSERPYESTRHLNSPNRNLSPLSAALDSQERLTIGGCLLSELADRYGTPLYVLDELSLRTSCRAYQNSLRTHYRGESIPLYASKANSSLAISSLIHSEGFGLDAVSEGELITALKAGIPGNKIVLHGNNKSRDELLLAYENDVMIIIDNKHDIELLDELIGPKNTTARLMLRFTPGIECHTHDYIRTGHIDSKFGFDPDQLENVLHILKDKQWASIQGLHAHIGSQIFELQPHQDLASVMADAYQLAKQIGHPVKDINIGGGLGIRYIQKDDPPSIDDWVKCVASSVEKAFQERNLKLPRLMIEPGRSLVATAGITLYKLGSIKEIPGIRKYISIDGGMSDNPRPITYQSLYTACLADRPIELPQKPVTIAGKHCESGDVLIKDCLLPVCKSGEILVIFSTGAYNASMSSNYNRIPRPASVLVHKGNSELIQKREKPEDLLRFDLVPERLKR